MSGKSETPIIKKIKKAGHGGHHGGAWKVAYADFVTAMMAFFLLMWLLNATEAENLAGLADYFAPTIGIKGQMGIGFRGGRSALSSGIGADKNTNKGIVFGGVPNGPIVKVTEKIISDTKEADAEKIALLLGSNVEDNKDNFASSSELESALTRFINDVAKENNIQDAVNVTERPEGLEIQIRDTNGESMFEAGTADFRPRIAAALQKLSEIISRLPNYISVTGHTSSASIQGKANYTNWELSMDRANATRRLLTSSGVQPEQIAMVIGKSDNEPLDTKNPDSMVNNRISIVLLRQSVLASHKKGAPEGVFLDSESKEAKDLINESNEKEKMLQNKDNVKQPENSRATEEKIKETEDLKETIEKTLDKKESYPEPNSSDINTPNNTTGKDGEQINVPDFNRILREESIQNGANKAKERPGAKFIIDDTNVSAGTPLEKTNDPFAGEGASGPDKLFVKETGGSKKIEKEKPVNSELFEEKDSPNETPGDIPTADPQLPGM